MMEDADFNFHQVCDSAEAYFSTIDKNAKGSGYKPFLRWKYENEKRYYPSGTRNHVAPNYVQKEYQNFIKANGTTPTKDVFNGGWNELGPLFIDSITGQYSAGLGRIEDFYVNLK